MFNYVWPIALVVLSNAAYQVCAKAAPEGMHPLASLTITYAVGALFSAAMYFFLNPGGNLLREYGRANAAPFVFGVVLVGLELGWICAYRAGWPVSTASVVQSAFLAAALLVVGRLLYGEALSWNKLLGVAICMIGLAFINRK